MQEPPSCIFSFTFLYLAFLPLPTSSIFLSLTIVPKTASTVVGLTSGKMSQISDLEIAVKLFNIVASTLAFYIFSAYSQ